MLDEPRLVASMLNDPWDSYVLGWCALGMAAFEHGVHWGFCLWRLLCLPYHLHYVNLVLLELG